MSHSKCRNWIHLVITIKFRKSILIGEIEKFIHEQLRTQLINMDCEIAAINGIENHVHLLFLLNPNKSLSEVVKQIKGASTRAINQTDLLKQKFSWSVGYGAFSVSESGIPAVTAYILHQKTHHSR